MISIILEPVDLFFSIMRMRLDDVNTPSWKHMLRAFNGMNISWKSSLLRRYGVMNEVDGMSLRVPVSICTATFNTDTNSPRNMISFTTQLTVTYTDPELASLKCHTS